jgi:hypothetical protein
MKKILLSLLLVGMLFSFTPVAKAQSVPSQQELTQQLIVLLNQLIAQLQKQINDLLAQQALTSPQPVVQQQIQNNQVNLNTATQIQETHNQIVNPSATAIAPLVFTETPKLIFKEVQPGLSALSSITWTTNRTSKLVVSPIFPDDSGWTTAGGAWESCGRANVSRQINSACRIKVIDSYGKTTEYLLEVFKDSIDL